MVLERRRWCNRQNQCESQLSRAYNGPEAKAALERISNILVHACPSTSQVQQGRLSGLPKREGTKSSLMAKSPLNLMLRVLMIAGS